MLLTESSYKTTFSLSNCS